VPLRERDRWVGALRSRDEDALGRLSAQIPEQSGAAECDGAADHRRGHQRGRSRDAVL
jgi:hypothetical protein